VSILADQSREVAPAVRTLATIMLSLALTSTTRAATVTVLRPDGSPAAEAAVLCQRHEKAPALTGDDGRASVPDDCLLVTCMAGEYVPGRAEVVSGAAVCRLIEGARVTLRLEDSSCGADCVGALDPVALGGDRVSREFAADSERAQRVANLGVVRLGRYVAELRGDVESWICRKPVELRRAGEETIQAAWRPPHELRGVVVADDGTPVAEVPVRVRVAEARAQRPPDAWHCLRDEWAPDLFSAGDGSFTIPVDPAFGGVIEAGSAWDPDGSASVEVEPPIPDSVTLRLKRAR
jgi:hypothetical protein